MKKGLISLLGGIILGVIISYFTLGYNGLTYYIHGRDETGGPVQVIHDIDVDLLMNGLLIVVGISILIYFIWTLAEKKIGNH